MAIGPGTQFGVYAVGEMLGKGGMGEVYQARDTKLDRIVAIKVLPASVASDRELLARFEREAKTLASLNHTNIAHVYGLEDFGGVMALVMEYVPGPTLRERLSKGAVPVKEAIGIARQIASALEAAHENGIIHRDLKPANVKLTADGAVKLLDFGLAKSVAPSKAPTDETETMAFQDTGTGMILGTAGYMAPEQVLGSGVDRRADVWAYGAVLYELLSGKRAFAGSTLAEVMAATLRAEVDWSALPGETPGKIRTLLERCLERDRNARIRDIGDAWRLLPESAPMKLAAAFPVKWAALAAALAIALAGAIFLRPAQREGPPLRRFTVNLGDDVRLATGTGQAVALSKDGTRIAYVALGDDQVRRLYTRRLDQSKARLLAGTEMAGNPFFSPDGEWIAFFAGNKLKKISAEGGSVVSLCDTEGSRVPSGAWGEDGKIIASFGFGLMRLPANGGNPEPLAKLAEGETFHRWPSILPGGKAVLFFSSTKPYADQGAVEVLVIATGERKVLQRNAHFGRYLASGHLLWLSQGTAFVAPFDAERLELKGAGQPVFENVERNDVTGSAHLDVSADGTLLFVERQGLPRSTIQWLDSAGRYTPIAAKPADYSFPALSPDGKQLAYLQQMGNNRDIWVHDLVRDVSRRLTLTPDDNEYVFVWTPDGKALIYSSDNRIRMIRVDSSAEAVTIFQHKQSSVFVHGISPDGRQLAFCIQGVTTGNDLWTLPLEWNGDRVTAGEPKTFQATQFYEIHAGFSPDGKWLAFTSDESGMQEVYARSFPGGAGKVQISSGGGAQPVWLAAGKDLYYVSGDGQPMVVSYQQTRDAITFSKPRPWAERKLGSNTSLRRYTVSPDGKRLVVTVPEESQAARKQNEVVFLENFFSELRRMSAK